MYGLNNIDLKIKLDINLVSKFFLMYSLFLFIWSFFIENHVDRLVILFFVITMSIAFLLSKTKRIIPLYLFIFFNLFIKFIFYLFIDTDLFWWREGSFSEDDTKYFNSHALIVYNSFFNGDIILPSELIKYGRNGLFYSYSIGFWYIITEPSVKMIPILHILMQSVTILYLYKISRRIFNNRKISDYVMIIYIFAPSTFLWYLFGLKEIFVSMLLVISIYYMILLYFTKSNFKLLIILVITSVWYILFIDRIYMAFFLMVLHIFFIYNISIHGYKKIFLRLLIILLTLFVIYFITSLALDYFISLASIDRLTDGTSGLSAFSYPIQALRLLITPLPYKITLNITNVHIIQAYNFLYHLFLVALSIYGFYKTFKSSNKVWIIFILFVMFILSFSLIGPGLNRIRDDFIPFLSIFSVIGIVYFINKSTLINKMGEVKS